MQSWLGWRSSDALVAVDSWRGFRCVGVVLEPAGGGLQWVDRLTNWVVLQSLSPSAKQIH